MGRYKAEQEWDGVTDESEWVVLDTETGERQTAESEADARRIARRWNSAEPQR